MASSRNCLRSRPESLGWHAAAVTSADAVPGLLALVGSGEYLEVMHEVEGRLLDAAQAQGRPRRYVQLATAAAPEGDRALEYWHRLGASAAIRLEAEQVIIDVRTAADAQNPSHVTALQNAGLIYLSGGNPTFLADTLVGTPVGDAILQQWRAGASLGGCSAGAMALGHSVPNLRRLGTGSVPGLGAVQNLRVLPHFDRWAGHLPDRLLRRMAGPGHLIGIDEDTALVGDGRSFEVMGRQAVWSITASGRQAHRGDMTLTIGMAP
jgi:cyanophycinase